LRIFVRSARGSGGIGRRGAARGSVEADRGATAAVVRLRFEPWLPPREAFADAGQAQLLDRLQEVICRCWLQATGLESQSMEVEVSPAEVAGILRKLDFSLLEVADLVCKIIKADALRSSGVGVNVSPKRRRC